MKVKKNTSTWPFLSNVIYGYQNHILSLECDLSIFKTNFVLFSVREYEGVERKSQYTKWTFGPILKLHKTIV